MGLKGKDRVDLKKLERKYLNRTFQCAITTCRSRNTYYDKKSKAIICWDCGFINFIDNR